MTTRIFKVDIVELEHHEPTYVSVGGYTGDKRAAQLAIVAALGGLSLPGAIAELVHASGGFRTIGSSTEARVTIPALPFLRQYILRAVRIPVIER